MTITNEPGTQVAVPTELVTVIIDGVAIGVPKGTLVIRAAEMLGIEIPRFCDHPLLEPVAACRACLIEIDGVPKPQPACAQVVSDGMQVHTQYSSDVARLAQEGVMEFLLLNHPLDCPVCDKGGECPLQNQAMSIGRPESRFTEEKRTFDKPINVSAQILLDRERCVSCARCTRFADQIAGDPMLELLERGAQQQVGTADDQPFDSYFSGNTIQICPVGALTSATYRFRARPFDLVSVPTSCEHCASGCALRTDYRRSTVTRRLAWDDPQVNEEWNCDKGRFAFAYLQQGRIEWPLVRENGELRTASWPEALAVAARGLQSAGTDTAVLVGGRSTMEDAYAYSRFARVALGTDNIDFRARANSEEEREFLAAHIAGTPIKVEYADLENAPIVLLACFEPEDESPIVFLRLRKAASNASGKNVTVVSVAAGATRGLAKMNGTLIPAKPGQEAAALANLPQDIQQALAQPGAVIMVGERAASSPGTLSAAVQLSQQTGAALAWVPRRAGERGALDAGAIAGLLPGGRPISDPTARSEVAQIWGIEVSALPQQGLSGLALHDAVDAGRIRGVVVGGVELSDYPHQAAEALGKVDFIVSLENHHSAVTEMADVVLPVGVVTEKSGTFLDWEGRPRPFGQVFRDAMMGSDASVLAMLADSMGHSLPGAVNDLRAQMGRLGPWTGARATMGPTRASTTTDGVRLETWRLLLDLGVMQEGDAHLAATARPTVARMSARTAQAHGIAEIATVHGPAGSITAPVEIDDSMIDSVVWLPMNSDGSRIYRDLGAGYGDGVRLAAGTQAGGLS